MVRQTTRMNKVGGFGIFLDAEEGYRMRKMCNGSASYKGVFSGRTLGLLLMGLGVILLLFFVPYWVWTAALAVLLISIGFLIWRF